jgi:hypothetical protein
MFRRLAPVYSIFVILAGLTFIREAAVGPFARWERVWHEWLQQRVTPAVSPGPVTLVEINDDTLQKHPWPWGPDDFSLFFHAGTPFEPPVLVVESALDFERGAFSGRERQPMFEKMLLDHIHRAPKLILGGRLGWSQDAQSVPEVQPMAAIRRVRGDITPIPEFTTVETWAREDYRLPTLPGWVNIPEQDPPAARCPMVLRYRGQVVPAMVLQTLMLWEKVTPDEVEVVLGSHIAVGSAVRIPIDSRGSMDVNLRAPFNRAAFDDFILTRQQVDSGAETQLPPDVFKKKALFLARTDAGAQTTTLQGGRKVPAGEMFAAALATVNAKAWVVRVESWFDWTLILFIAVGAMWLQRWKWWVVLLVSLIFLSVYLGAAIWCVGSKLTLLPGILPLALVDLLILLRFAIPKKLRVIIF